MAPRPLVVVLSAAETFVGLAPAARAVGLAVLRVEAIRPFRCRPRWVSGRAGDRAPIDTLLITSPHAVGRGLLTWSRRLGGGRTPEAWASGPETAARLRRAGFRAVRRGPGLGVEGLIGAIGPGTRSLVYLRSDLAGAGTARALRALGHRVLEVVGYRVIPRPATVRRHARAIRRASVIVLASPSAVLALRRALGVRPLRRLGRTVPAVVLGELTARAATAAGFRFVRASPSVAPQRFASFLVRVVADAAR